MKFIKNVMDLAEAKELENAKALVAKQGSYIEYLAMMSGIDIPTDEENEVINNG